MKIFIIVLFFISNILYYYMGYQLGQRDLIRDIDEYLKNEVEK